mmetsp:Transcript_86450/g.220296  ORF Transcript_86450/g.220296 Transcript_86450/m.220296 type:complete len:269 (+) Transcript_86450:45-851(+)
MRARAHGAGQGSRLLDTPVLLAPGDEVVDRGWVHQHGPFAAHRGTTQSLVQQRVQQVGVLRLHEVPRGVRQEGAVDLDLLHTELGKRLLPDILKERLEGDLQDADDGPVPVEGDRGKDLELFRDHPLDLQLHGNLEAAQGSALGGPAPLGVAEDARELGVEGVDLFQDHSLDEDGGLSWLPDRHPILVLDGVPEKARHSLASDHHIVRDHGLRGPSGRPQDPGRRRPVGARDPVREEVGSHRPNLVDGFGLEMPPDAHQREAEEATPV